MVNVNQFGSYACLPFTTVAAARDRDSVKSMNLKIKEELN